jgi:aspartate/methionine/tyrosine aminotransferase
MMTSLHRTLSLFFLLHAHTSGVWASVSPAVPTETVPTTTKRLTEDSMSQKIRTMEYAVRGKIVIAADLISDDLKTNGAAAIDKYGFDHIVYTNIGNPQSVGQKPLTWPRQVMALVDLPEEVGVNHPAAKQLFPTDAIQRAKEIKAALACGSSGAYSHSKGVRQLRNDVAHFIAERDGGIATDPEDIFLTNGASAGIVMILNALLADSTW